MSATPYPVPPQQSTVEDRPAGGEVESQDGTYSISGSNVDYSQESGQGYSESEKDTNGSSFEKTTGGSGSEISDAIIDISGQVITPQPRERTIRTSRKVTTEEYEGEESTIDSEDEGEVTTVFKGPATIADEEGSQLTERTDQPRRALRSKGAAPSIQLGAGEAVEKVTATAWISKSKGTLSTIQRDETGGPEHRRQSDDLDVQLGDGSLKTLTVGHEDDLSASLPQGEVEESQREPADLTGISSAAAGRDSQEVFEEDRTSTPFPVRRLATSLGRDIRRRTNYQVVEQTETPSRGPRTLVSEVTPAIRQLRFDFTPVKEATTKEQRKEYGKRKRGEEQALDYEVETILRAGASTKGTTGTGVARESRSPEKGEETITTGGREDVNEERENVLATAPINDDQAATTIKGKDVNTAVIPKGKEIVRKSVTPEEEININEAIEEAETTPAVGGVSLEEVTETEEGKSETEAVTTEEPLTTQQSTTPAEGDNFKEGIEVEQSSLIPQTQQEELLKENRPTTGSEDKSREPSNLTEGADNPPTPVSEKPHDDDWNTARIEKEHKQASFVEEGIVNGLP